MEKIPIGFYCYDIKICPYWSLNKNYPDQLNGYCSYMQKGDWDYEELSLLWDQIKQCNINLEI